jgi:hypothetical protein
MGPRENGGGPHYDFARRLALQWVFFPPIVATNLRSGLREALGLLRICKKVIVHNALFEDTQGNR